AIFLALAACGIRAGDEVIVPDITFSATAKAVRLAGATPVLAAIEPMSFCIDPAAVEARRSHHAQRRSSRYTSGDGRHRFLLYLHDYLLTRQIETRKYWYPLHTQAPYRADEASFPISREISPSAPWLPSSLTLTD